MVTFLKKVFAFTNGLHANFGDFTFALLLALGYSISLTFTTQTVRGVEVVVNFFIFLCLSAGVKSGNSLYNNLSIEGKDRVKLGYQTFCCFIVFILLCKMVVFLASIFMILHFSNGSIWDSFYLKDPDIIAYRLAGVYGFCISIGFEFLLFPIIFIHKKMEQFKYFIKVMIITLAPTIVLNTIGLNLCKTQEEHQYNLWFSAYSFEGYPRKILYLFICYAIIFMFVSIFLSFIIANKQYKREMQQKFYFFKKEKNLKIIKRIIWGVFTIVVLSIIIAVIYVSSLAAKELGKIKGKEVVGTQLTENSVFGPMVMEHIIYMPTKGEFELKKEKEMGLFTYKGEDASGIMYGLFFSNYAYVDPNDANKTYCVVSGCDHHSYVRADYMEENFEIDKYKNIVALEPDFLDLQAYADEGSRVGIHDVDLELFRKLEELYGTVKYKEEDFDKIDTYYAVIGTENNYVKIGDWDSEANFYLNCSEVMGYILESDGKYYYGNLENLIPQDLSMDITTILATNKK